MAGDISSASSEMVSDRSYVIVSCVPGNDKSKSVLSAITGYKSPIQLSSVTAAHNGMSRDNMIVFFSFLCGKKMRGKQEWSGVEL